VRDGFLVLTSFLRGERAHKEFQLHVLEDVTGQVIYEHVFRGTPSVSPLRDGFLFEGFEIGSRRSQMMFLDTVRRKVLWTQPGGPSYPPIEWRDRLLIHMIEGLRLVHRDDGAILWERPLPRSSLGGGSGVVDGERWIVPHNREVFAVPLQDGSQHETLYKGARVGEVVQQEDRFFFGTESCDVLAIAAPFRDPAPPHSDLLAD